MASVVAFPIQSSLILGVPALAARLRLIESVESLDESVMDAAGVQEELVLAALTDSPAEAISDIAEKVAAVTRRAEAAGGYISEAEIALLASALADLWRTGMERAFA